MTVFAVGFTIVALVKPTTASVLAIGITGLTLPFARRALTNVIFAGSLSFLLVMLVLLSIDGELPTAIPRYRTTLSYSELSSGQ
jgi:hypothetical protein